MRKQPLTLVSLLLIGCFALTILSFTFFMGTDADTSYTADTISFLPCVKIKNGELLSEILSRQFLRSVFTK